MLGGGRQDLVSLRSVDSLSYRDFGGNDVLTHLRLDSTLTFGASLRSITLGPG